MVILIPILQMKTLRPRTAKYLAQQGRTADICHGAGIWTRQPSSAAGALYHNAHSLRDQRLDLAILNESSSEQRQRTPWAWSKRSFSVAISSHSTGLLRSEGRERSPEKADMRDRVAAGERNGDCLDSGRLFRSWKKHTDTLISRW